MQEMIFLSICPDDLYFYWQIRVQLNNFRRLGFNQKYLLLLYVPPDRVDRPNPIFDKLVEDFENVEVHRYFDHKQECYRFLSHFKYVSLLRPWAAKKHFEKHPELNDKAFFYIDQDVIFARYFDFNKFLQDDINYLSWTGRKEANYNYINWDYFQKQEVNLDPQKVEKFHEAKPLDKLFELCGISKDIVEKNNSKTGGAQYLLKGIDSKFWGEVFDLCLVIKTKLEQINRFFFKGATEEEKQNNGYQAWCADMWAVLWNLWKRGKETECPDELNFSWATDDISVWDKCNIYHHTGGDQISKDGVVHHLFNKRKLPYVNNEITPFEDLEYVKITSKDFCAYHYAQEVLNTSS